MLRDPVLREPDVSLNRWALRKIPTVKRSELRIDFGREDALMPETLECDAEAAKAGEKVNEFHRRSADEDRDVCRKLGIGPLV